MKFLVSPYTIQKNKHFLINIYSNITPRINNKIQSLIYPLFLYTNLNKNIFSNYFYKWNCTNALKNVVIDFSIQKKIKYTTKKLTSLKRSNNISLLLRFLNFLVKNGLKIRYANILSSGVLKLYSMFFFFNKTLASENKYYKDMFLVIPNFLNFYSFKIILHFFSSLLEPFFYMRVKKVEKKYRKKLKKKFTIQPIYVKPQKRVGFVLKTLVNYTNLFSSYSLSERMFLSLFKTLIEQKNSFLYRRKLYMYSKLFKNNQRRVF